MKSNTVDQREIDRFSALAEEWWNPSGKFRPMHKFNPVRIDYIRKMASENFGRDPFTPQPLKGLRVLDIGCGGGLLSEPMARMGADIVGADASERNIRIASIHARKSGLDIDYRATTAEQLALAGETFDIILNMEVVEHVADVDVFFVILCPDGAAWGAHVRCHHQSDHESRDTSDIRGGKRPALVTSRNPSISEACEAI